MASITVSFVNVGPRDAAETSTQLLRLLANGAPDCRAERATASPQDGAMSGVEIGTLILQLLATPAVLQLIACLKRLVARPEVEIEIADGKGGTMRVKLRSIDNPETIKALTQFTRGDTREAP